ncbi:hypothetical protein [Virgibacillus dakarensis]|nr:hypothetical protein [Virgibacillus dakarensis]
MMIPIIFTILTVVGLIVSTFVLAQKRKRKGITGIKSALSSICLFLVAITNLLAYWLNFSGIVSWGLQSPF